MQMEIIDDLGTTPEEGRELLQHLLDNGFEGDVGKLALTLGRPAEQIGDLVVGNGEIDEDLVMKVRGIAEERGINI